MSETRKPTARRIATRLVGHASWVLPGARSDWAEAMRREIEYIEDDAAALRWAVGCVTASYRSRLAALAQRCWRVSPGPVVAGSALLLMAMALQGHASDDATPPALDRTGCKQFSVPPEIQNRDHDELHQQGDASAALCAHEERDRARNGNP